MAVLAKALQVRHWVALVLVGLGILWVRNLQVVRRVHCCLAPWQVVRVQSCPKEIKDFSGFFGQLNYYLNNGAFDGYKYNLAGEATGIAPIILEIPDFGGISKGEMIKFVAKGGQPIIGEGMKRVGTVAAQNPGSVILNTMPKFTGTANQVTSQMMTYNRTANEKWKPYFRYWIRCHKSKPKYILSDGAKYDEELFKASS